MEGRAAAARRRVRLDGRHADVGRAISARYVGAFLAAWPPRDGAETRPGPARVAARDAAGLAAAAGDGRARRGDGALQLNAGGYGFGLGISQTCDFAHIVAHSGGLPGFGSLMRWLPEYGVGIIAFGNLTYTGLGRRRPTTRSTLLAKTGGLEPRDAAAVAGARRARATRCRG